MFGQVRKRLFELETAAKEWKGGAFDYLNTLPSKATPESESRLRQFTSRLTIPCPDGEQRLFSLHLRLTPGAWRLYFFPVQSAQIIVGYIGLKIV
ncbi:hypothetical protein K4A83_04460 [Spirulina subsalsa FACHB-351]|uniref:Uncharacterized protein n=1 Tax=Spirulina subsalsa FACHB-351 TaxID=234711 RepID=A0ABT3L1Z7_9CYAN|nr:hypothetical protein [Spirulina subsalsa]MCW6035527.1 hypothetical protein [Spirulina subsalsa FACHB-351]